jgi:hypothetical protein
MGTPGGAAGFFVTSRPESQPILFEVVGELLAERLDLVPAVGEKSRRGEPGFGPNLMRIAVPPLTTPWGSICPTMV